MLLQSPSTARRNQIVPNVKEHNERCTKFKLLKFQMQQQSRKGRKGRDGSIKVYGIRYME